MDPQLAALIDDATARLTAAVADRHAAMHAPVVVTADGDARIMVLRGCGDDGFALRFHTDLRAPKVAIIAGDPRVTVLAYDPAARVQLRMTGTARIDHDGPAADLAWAKASAMSRRVYLTQTAPGAAQASAGADLPEHLRIHRPTLPESEAGRARFAVLDIGVTRLDWLQLGREGGTRARFERATIHAPWTGTWIAP